MTPRGLRNNNPGNVRASDTAWQGQVGADDAGFCVFDMPENGIRCLARTLLTYQSKHGLTSLRQIVNRWAPESENDTEAYLENVCHFCFASPDNPYTLTPSRLMALVSAIIKHENGVNPYALEVVQQGVDSAYR